MMWEGLWALPFTLLAKMLLLMRQLGGVSERAIARFEGKAQRAVGVRGEVCVFITSSGDVRAMNRRFRGKDQPTDILTFRLAPNRTNSAGDVAIAAEIAEENAAAQGHSTETELKILILHGLLHLAGYDHETDNGEMQARETELRRQLKLPAGLIERAHGAGSPSAGNHKKASVAHKQGSRQ